MKPSFHSEFRARSLRTLRQTFDVSYMAGWFRLLATGILFSLSTACSAQPNDRGAVDARSVKLLALTFDDGPTAQVTPALLDVLKRHNAKATFFPIGENVRAAPALMRRIAAEGHSIGNHTLSHARLTGMSDKAARAEVKGANALVKSITRQTPVVFRPPYAALDSKVAEIARADELAIILWTIYPETLGGIPASSVISDRVVSSARDGDIVFMHDTSMRSVEATEAIIQQLSAKGFKFVTVPELIRHRGQFAAGQTYKTGRGADE